MLSRSPEISFFKKMLFDGKMFLKKHIRYGGPLAVQYSLISGLRQLGPNFLFNPPLSEISPGATVGVLTGVDALAWALEAKKEGRIAKVIAGPNLVVTPLEEQGILTDPMIDVIVVPGKWVEDFYVSVTPSLQGKIAVWPAGVDVPKLGKPYKKYDALIYNKCKDGALADAVAEDLRNMEKTFYRMDYGKVSQREYFSLLNQSRLLVYIAESESQGIAMFESWSRDVPSLVWERNLFTYQNYRFPVRAASEYVSPEVGHTFSGKEDFKTCYERLTQSNLRPRDFIKQHYSHIHAARHYIDIATKA